MSIENRIRQSLSLLCQKLEDGERSDAERTKFQDDLSGAIDEAIALAIEKHLKDDH